MIEISLRHRLGAFTLDAEFRAGPGITALFGPSGAGKTSIVNAIAGLVHPCEGRIVVDGCVLLDTENGIDIPAHQRRIACVFQDARLFPHMNVKANLLFGWRRAQTRASEGEITRIITMLGLEHLLARKPARLSGGEKSRVGLGRALLSSPTLLLLDEPLAALDDARKSEILPYLERLRDEVPMLYVSHSVDEVLRLSNDVVLLRDGHVTGTGSVFQFASGEIGDAATGGVIDARVTAHRDDGLSELSFDGGMLIVSRVNRTIGSALRVRIRAEDVMLAREEPRAISANNVLPAEILDVRETSAAQADIILRCGAAHFTARITRASLARLGLAPGQKVFAIVKSVTIDPQI
ncbi:MAG TPA: molybdenum ABC transporter ATP-binding protein [Rhizomicrobium sp.]